MSSSETLPNSTGWDGVAANVTLGIFMRRAAHIWGPWTPATRIYTPTVTIEGYCTSMYWDQNGAVTPKPPGATFGGCPANLLTQNAALNRYIRGSGGEYGADVLERFSISNPTGATVYWLMSTWNPYRVIVQRTVVTAPQDRCSIDDLQRDRVVIQIERCWRSITK